MKKIFSLIIFTLITFCCYSKDFLGYDHYIEIANNDPIIDCWKDANLQEAAEQHYNTLFYAYSKNKKALIIVGNYTAQFDGSNSNFYWKTYTIIDFNDFLKLLSYDNINMLIEGLNFSFYDESEPNGAWTFGSLYLYSTILKNGYLNIKTSKLNTNPSKDELAKNYFYLGQSIYNLPSIIEGKLKELPSN